MPGVGPPPGRGGTTPGLGRGGMPGAGADGRGAGGRGGIPGVPSEGVLKGLLPGRGPGVAGRGGRPAGAGGADGAEAAGAATSGAAGRAGPGNGDDGRAAAGAVAPDGVAPGDVAPGANGAAAAGEAVGAEAAAAGAGAAGKASRSLRATGASTVEDADLTNSPFSFSQLRTFLLSIPSSLASSWTRALPGTVLLLGPGPSLAWLLVHGDAHRCWLIERSSADAVHQAVDPLSSDGEVACRRPATCSRTGATSSGSARCRARGNARRFSARSTQRGSRCTEAPRPGRRPAGSGVREAVPCSQTTTTRSRVDFAAFARQPTQVRTGPGWRAVVQSSAPGSRGRERRAPAMRRQPVRRPARRRRSLRRCGCRSASR